MNNEPRQERDMIQPAPRNDPQSSPGAAVAVTTHHLTPADRARFGDGEYALVVEDGVVFLTLQDGEVALIPGEEFIVRPGGLWYASSIGGPARVVVLRRAR
jgi:hypothetical protein